MKYFYFLSLLLLSSLYSLAQNKDSTSYKHLIKLVETNYWYKQDYVKTIDNTLESQKDHEFSTSFTPALVLITPKRHLIEFEPNLSFSTNKETFFKGPHGVIWDSAHNDYSIPDNLSIEEIIKSRKLKFSIRASYNYNLLKRVKGLFLTVGPALYLQYDYAKNDIHERFNGSLGLHQANLIQLKMQVIAKMGTNLGKRAYVEVAVPQDIYYIGYGKELFNGRDTIDKDVKPYFSHFGYLKNPFSGQKYYTYYTYFHLQFSVGYKF